MKTQLETGITSAGRRLAGASLLLAALSMSAPVQAGISSVDAIDFGSYFAAATPNQANTPDAFRAMTPGGFFNFDLEFAVDPQLSGTDRPFIFTPFDGFNVDRWEFRNFFVFDLSQYAGVNPDDVSAARLVLPAGWGSETQTFQLFRIDGAYGDVGGGVDTTLDWGPVFPTYTEDFRIDINKAVFNDLGNGDLLGETTDSGPRFDVWCAANRPDLTEEDCYFDAVPFTYTTIELNALGLADVTDNLGGLWAIGGKMTGQQFDTYRFLNAYYGFPQLQLIIPAPAPAILLLAGLAGFAVLRRR